MQMKIDKPFFQIVVVFLWQVPKFPSAYLVFRWDPTSELVPLNSRNKESTMCPEQIHIYETYRLLISKKNHNDITKKENIAEQKYISASVMNIFYQIIFSFARHLDEVCVLDKLLRFLSCAQVPAFQNFSSKVMLKCRDN